MASVASLWRSSGGAFVLMIGVFLMSIEQIFGLIFYVIESTGLLPIIQASMVAMIAIAIFKMFVNRS